MTTWTETDSTSERQWAETGDPRMVAIVERDENPTPPDGDAYSPAYWLEFGNWGAWNVNAAGSTANADDAAEQYAEARSRRLGADGAARYMRIFHDVAVELVNGTGAYAGDTVLLLDTPEYRTAMGRPEDYAGDVFAGDRETWSAYMSGDVYAVGYAVNPNRLDASEPVDLEDWAWRVETECYGFYGLEWAREAAPDYVPAPESAGLSPEATTRTREAVATMVELEATVQRLQRDGWWHPGMDHGAARYAADVAELAAIRDEDGAELSRMYGGGVFAVFDDGDRAELVDRTRAYWGLSAIVRTAAGA